ncbi:Outer envelope protein 80, chloroplastic [Apostasia shenzhenica]|uniref:Outer envelope protein 80, chloroplastic n=1 Tax=Apostasia shenzhenica TaxID=1088818 RepID=A0A2I0BE36_9ASPA|nr:Outer envelope protein 80, chloroplastic [Apostasia shenzhenica]
MGAQKSIHAGKAKIDFNVDLTHKLCGALLAPPLRNSSSPFSQIVGRVSIKHPNIFGGSEKFDLLWNKGLQDSNVVIAIRRPRPEWLSQQSFVIQTLKFFLAHCCLQHSITPEIAVHGLPVNNLSQSGSCGINISRFSAGVDLTEPPNTKWSTKTSIRFELLFVFLIQHVHPFNDDGRSISLDNDGFPITCSGTSHDNMVVLKQESFYAIADDNRFSRLNFQMEQGLPLLSKWLIFNRFKFVASKGFKVGPALLVTSLTGGSIVGDMAPHQAFSIGGYGSVRGYGEGAVGAGRSCLVLNSEFTVPLSKQLEGAVFMDCGTDLGSAHLVPGYPAIRRGKPGYGVGFGYGLRLNSHLGQFRVDYAVNALQRKTVYFGINGVT